MRIKKLITVTTPYSTNVRANKAAIPAKLMKPIGGINLLKNPTYGSQIRANNWPNVDWYAPGNHDSKKYTSRITRYISIIFSSNWPISNNILTILINLLLNHYNNEAVYSDNSEPFIVTL